MKTLLMVKPDTVASGNVGDILALVERNKFKIRRLTLTQFSKERAERFYDMHRARPFFGANQPVDGFGDAPREALHPEATRRLCGECRRYHRHGLRGGVEIAL